MGFVYDLPCMVCNGRVRGCCYIEFGSIYLLGISYSFYSILRPRLDGSTTTCTVSDFHLVRWSKWSVWISSWLSTANFLECNRQKIFFFFFSISDFYGLINLYTKSFSLWRRQKYHHRSSLIDFQLDTDIPSQVCVFYCKITWRYSKIGFSRKCF